MLNVFERKLCRVIKEAISRLKPAMITMKRGTIIKADHARYYKLNSGTTILVAGIGPGRHRRIKYGSSTTGVIKNLRDFYYKDEWITSREAAQWNPTHVVGKESMACIRIQKFNKIFTMNPENIANVEWL